MFGILAEFQEAHRVGDGRLLAACLAPINTKDNPRRLESFAQLSNYQTVSAYIRYHLLQGRDGVKLPKTEGNGWVEIFVSLWKCVKELIALEQGNGGDWTKAFDSYREVCNQLIRGYTNNGFQYWTVPCLYTAGKYFRMIASRTDRELKPQDGSEDVFANGFTDDIMGNTDKNEKLEQAAWILNRMFTVCLSDRSDLSESRKWGIISTTNLLFKTYFKLNSIALTKNVIRALAASEADLPPLQLFPKAQRCTFKYYRGVIDFLQEDYSNAETNLTEALTLCHKNALNNREQILTYLIPTQLISHQKVPTTKFLASHPNLVRIFDPFFSAIRKGSLAAFDEALSAAEGELVKRRIYLTLERTRDICMRNLFRKVFLAAGFEESKDATTAAVEGAVQTSTTHTRRTRIRIEEFEAGMRVGYRGSTDVIIDRDEVECFLANMIYKNFMKGYIARERGIVVLSKAGAFPGTGV